MGCSSGFVSLGRWVLRVGIRRRKPGGVAKQLLSSFRTGFLTKESLSKIFPAQRVTFENTTLHIDFLSSPKQNRVGKFQENF